MIICFCPLAIRPTSLQELAATQVLFYDADVLGILDDSSGGEAGTSQATYMVLAHKVGCTPNDLLAVSGRKYKVCLCQFALYFAGTKTEVCCDRVPRIIRELTGIRRLVDISKILF